MSPEISEIYNLFSPSELSEGFKLLVKKQLEEDMYMGDGFELGAHPDTLEHFLPASKMEEFESKFTIFGQATHSGSLYAFYRAANTSNTDEYPILVLGDEGGALILAANLKSFVSFLTLDSAPYIETNYETETDEFSLYEEEEEEEDEEEETEDFQTWATTAFSIMPINDREEAKKQIIAPAQAKYQAEIDAILAE